MRTEMTIAAAGRCKIFANMAVPYSRQISSRGEEREGEIATLGSLTVREQLPAVETHMRLYTIADLAELLEKILSPASSHFLVTNEPWHRSRR